MVQRLIKKHTKELKYIRIKVFCSCLASSFILFFITKYHILRSFLHYSTWIFAIYLNFFVSFSFLFIFFPITSDNQLAEIVGVGAIVHLHHSQNSLGTRRTFRHKSRWGCLCANLNHKKALRAVSMAPRHDKRKKKKKTTFTSGDLSFTAGCLPIDIIHDAFFSWRCKVWGRSEN